MAERASRQQPKGRTKPRIAPPTPVRSLVKDFERTCEEMEVSLFPWQQVSARYAYAVAPNGNWLYPEWAEIASRQNGKTLPLRPHVVHRLRMGRKIMHTAQNRELPREVFSDVADFMGRQPGALARKGGRIRMPRFANGQEEIWMANGGCYRIVAPSRSGARGPANDDVLMDEVREMHDQEFIAAARPTLMASSNPQMAYKSNAGDEDSVVLNGLRARAFDDPSLAYLEWSAAPERDAGDRGGWYEANPSIGYLPGLLGNLERDYRSHKLQGTLAIFETENLCRWVVTTREPLVDIAPWISSQGEIGTPKRPSMAVSADPEGRRAAVALAWQMPDGNTALRVLFNVTGEPIDTDALGRDIRATGGRVGAVMTGFDPLTDAELAKYLTKTKPISGREYANASAQFVNLVTAGKLRWQDAEAVTDDLGWTARKTDTLDKGSFEAVRAKDDRPIPALLAAIRAVWLASGPRPASPRVM